MRGDCGTRYRGFVLRQIVRVTMPEVNVEIVAPEREGDKRVGWSGTEKDAKRRVDGWLEADPMMMKPRPVEPGAA